MTEQELREKSLRRKRGFALWGVFGSAALFGAADLFLYYSHTWTKLGGIIGSLAALVFVYLWCHFDARLRNKRITEWRVIAIILIAVLAIPAYLVETRGWKGAFKLGFGLPVIVGCYVTYYTAWYFSMWLAGITGYYEEV